MVLNAANAHKLVDVGCCEGSYELHILCLGLHLRSLGETLSFYAYDDLLMCLLSCIELPTFTRRTGSATHCSYQMQ